MLNILKPLKTVQQQLQTLPKLYRSHTWITPPGDDGLSFLGISDYAKRYFVRINKLDYDFFPKTNYGIANRQNIKYFIQQTQEQREKGQLALSQMMEWRRFQYKQGEAFSNLETIEFDVELQAPVDMRVVDIQYNTFYYRHLLSAPYFFKIHILNLSQLQRLDSEEQYLKKDKMIL